MNMRRFEMPSIADAARQASEQMEAEHRRQINEAVSLSSLAEQSARLPIEEAAAEMARRMEEATNG